jgi:phenylacetate-CoA ligase
MYDQHHETMDAQTREQLQMERLRQTIEHITRVTFYQERLQTLQMTANDFQTIEDRRKFPFTRKQELRDHSPFGLFAVVREEVTRIHASSGTSGKTTVVGYTQEDLDDWAGAVARSLVLAGGSPANLLHNAHGYGLFTGGLGLHAGAEKLGMTILTISGGNKDRQITLIEDFRPDGICGTPSYIFRLAERMIERGIDPRKTSMRYGNFGAEPWSEEMRQTLEQTFDLQALDIYGLSQILGPGVAMECQEQAGLHIMDDLFITEVVDPITGEPLPDSMVGELVFTSLKKKAFPIIRYRTGDLASITRKVWACGRTTTRMSRVKGRTDDMLFIRGVNVFPSEIERVLLQQPDVRPHYQIHLVRKAGLDVVELRIEFENISERQMRSICDSIKSECIISIDLVCHPHQGLPRSEGKAVRVVDRRSTSLV